MDFAMKYEALQNVILESSLSFYLRRCVVFVVLGETVGIASQKHAHHLEVTLPRCYVPKKRKMKH